MELLNQLAKFSNFYGSNPDLVLAGGGNTSAKTESTLYIKGSGTALATILPAEFVAMDRKALAQIFENTYSEEDAKREAETLADMMAARLPGQEAKRPSVETTLHSLFPHQFVLHLHPALVNGLTCGKRGKELAQKLWGERAVWIDLCRPGYILAKTCKDAMDAYKAKNGKDADFLMLQNHGVFFAADTPEALGEMLEGCLKDLQSCVSDLPDLAPVAPTAKQEAMAQTLAALYGDNAVCVGDYSKEALAFAENPAEIAAPFTPDHIVYCKAYPLFLADGAKAKEAFAQYKETYGYYPKAVFVKGYGAYALEESEKKAATVLTLMQDSMKIGVYSRAFGGALPMTEELIDFIVHWEAEAYRSKKN